jgi:hypothetical protein
LEGMEEINLAQDIDLFLALVNTVLKPRFPQTAGNFLTTFSTLVHGVSHVWWKSNCRCRLSKIAVQQTVNTTAAFQFTMRLYSLTKNPQTNTPSWLRRQRWQMAHTYSEVRRGK